MTADRRLRIGVVLEAFLDWPLDRVMPWLREHAPEVTDLEIGAGGYAPHPHCDVETLLASGQARAAWLGEIGRARGAGRGAERVGQPAAPRSGPGPGARPGPSRCHPAGHPARGQPRRRAGGLSRRYGGGTATGTLAPAG